MDAATIGAGIVGLNNLGSLVRNITGALKEGGKAEVISQVIDLQMLVSELIDKNRQLSDENHALRGKLEEKAKMKFNGLWYQREGDDTPFCPQCFEAEGKAIHLGRGYQAVEGWGRLCQNCGQFHKG